MTGRPAPACARTSRDPTHARAGAAASRTTHAGPAGGGGTATSVRAIGTAHRNADAATPGDTTAGDVRAALGATAPDGRGEGPGRGVCGAPPIRRGPLERIRIVPA